MHGTFWRRLQLSLFWIVFHYMDVLYTTYPFNWSKTLGLCWDFWWFWLELLEIFSYSICLNVFITQGKANYQVLALWIVSVQFLSHVRLFVTPWTAAQQAFLSITIFWHLLKLMSIKSMMPSNYLIFWCPLLLLPSIFPSIRVFSKDSILCIR